MGVALVARLNPTLHGTSLRQPCSTLLAVYCYKMSFHPRSTSILAQVRFLAYHRIKPHAPPLVRTPANSFEFQPCGRTSQVGYLMLSLRHQQCIADVEYPSFRAWTTRVSNPVCSPRFRASASIFM